VIAVIEVIVLVMKTYRLLPKVPVDARTPWQWEPLHGVLKFSLSIAFTSSVWVLVTQTDKLILSKLLPLSDYAYFTLAVLVAGGVAVISGPISGALMPRMTKLSAVGDDVGLIQLYRHATQLTGVISVPAAIMLVIFAEQVLWVWTGDTEIARKTAPVLTLYSLGNGILAIGSFPYYLQYSKGNMKLHMIGNIFFILFLIPSVILATLKFGMIGAGWSWLSANMIYFLFWVPFVHNRYAKGLHWSWLIEDVLKVSIPAFATALLMQGSFSGNENRIETTIYLFSIGVLLLITTCLSSSYVRKSIAGHFNKINTGG
jgi:O-antigen/teichoic acid export membrane protein